MFSNGKKIILSLVTSIIVANSALAVDNKVYATVNGDKITSEDIALAIRDPRVNFDTLPKATKNDIINKLIEQKLLSKDALHTDIIKSAEYIKSLETIKENLALQLLVKNMHDNMVVTDKDVKAFYNKYRSKFVQPAQLKASHILVKTKKEAEDIINSLKHSHNIKADFTKIAKEKSTGPSGVNGGELGWFTKEKMVPEFSNAVLKLKVGEFTNEPVQTQFGYHIIYLDDKKDETVVPLSMVKDKIIENIKQEKIMEELSKKVAQLKKSAKIEYK